MREELLDWSQSKTFLVTDVNNFVAFNILEL